MPPTLQGVERWLEGLPNGSLKRMRAGTVNKDAGLRLDAVPTEETHDLICVGFGPASLAIVIALHDAMEHSSNTSFMPKVCFLEQQLEFRWHSGMMLPSAKMQISFLKDLATQRDPRSRFTFLNYLRVRGRLAQFTNLSTFLPTRLEFADYMKWCASSFADVVEYGKEVVKVEPVKSHENVVKYDLLSVQARDADGETTTRRTRNLVVAVGGRANRPEVFPANHSRIIHSSVYASQILPALLKTRDKAYHIGVLGSGQSAAEVFNDLHSRYPNAHTHLIFRDTALRPSDDSPFVNEIFDDSRITPFFNQPATTRHQALTTEKSTNYSVVRAELLEKIYSDLYQQRILEADESLHKHKLHPSSEVLEVIDMPQNERVHVVLKQDQSTSTKSSKTTLSLDALIYATGYVRDIHSELLKDCQVINASRTGTWEVSRDYRVKLDAGFVDEGLNIFLQGCNEASHGLSDSLISVLATRGGEVVENIFGERLKENGQHVVPVKEEET